MEDVFISSTDKTPEVSFKLSGELHITGKSIPEDAEDFFAPLLKWLESYLENPAPTTSLNLNLEYFNISSSKRILFLLYKVNELVDKKRDVKVRWFFDDHDEDMFEVGQDYAFMVKVPFEFVEIDRVHAVNEKLASSKA